MVAVWLQLGNLVGFITEVDQTDLAPIYETDQCSVFSNLGVNLSTAQPA